MLLVLFFAGYLVLHRDALALAGRRFAGIDLPRGRDLGPILAMWLISLAILVFQRDLGSSLLFFGLFLVMLYVATERPGWLVVGGAMFLAGAYSAYLAARSRAGRASTRGCTRSTRRNNSYQLVQGMYGMAWGGLVGRGLGQGDPTLTPLGFSDFIMASIGEELGLTGVMAVLLLYGLIVERALRTALVCRDAFGKLVAVGLAVVFALQVFVVVGGVTKLIPLTGLTTPFLSYGGSSLVANWAIIALLLRISDQARRPLPRPARRSPDGGRRHPGGDVLPMNKPIRTMSIFCMLLFAALLLNATYLQYVDAGSLNSRVGQQAGARRGVLPQARRDRRRRHVGRGEQARPTTSTPTSASTSSRRKYAPLTGYYSYIYGRSGGGVEPERDPLRQRPAAVRQPGRRHARQQPAQGRVGVADRRPQGADGGVRRAARRSARTSRARSSPSSRRPARSWRWSPRRRTTPTGWPRTSSAKVQDAWKQLNADPDRPLLNRGDPGDLPARLDLQAGHRGGGAVQRAVHPGDQGQGRHRASTCRRPSTNLPNENGSNCGGDPITLTQALEVLLQRRPSATIGLKLGDDALRAQAEKFGFDQTYLNDLNGQVRSRVPRATSTSRRPRCPRSASTTSPPPRCRWRWSPPASPTTAR